MIINEYRGVFRTAEPTGDLILVFPPRAKELEVATNTLRAYEIAVDTGWNRMTSRSTLCRFPGRSRYETYEMVVNSDDPAEGSFATKSELHLGFSSLRFLTNNGSPANAMSWCFPFDK